MRDQSVARFIQSTQQFIFGVSVSLSPLLQGSSKLFLRQTLGSIYSKKSAYVQHFLPGHTPGFEPQIPLMYVSEEIVLIVFLGGEITDDASAINYQFRLGAGPRFKSGRSSIAEAGVF